jgi:hypothetical protein
MGGAFRLEQVVYYLDDNKIYFQDNRDGVLNDKEEFAIYDGNVVPGNHMISVEMVYRGSGSIFTYLKGYLFKIKSNYTFFASKGRIHKISVVGYEKGGITTDLEERPSVRYDVQQYQYSRENLEKENPGNENLGKESLGKTGEVAPEGEESK